MFFAVMQALYCFGLTLPADLRKKYMQIKAQHSKHRLLMPQQRSVHLLFFCALQIPSVLHVCESVFPSVSDAPADAQAVPAGSDPDKELPCARYYLLAPWRPHLCLYIYRSHSRFTAISSRSPTP